MASSCLRELSVVQMRVTLRGRDVGVPRQPAELVIRAFQRGETPEGIVRSYRTLHLADAYAIISRYLANPTPFEDYLRQCDDQAARLRREIEAAQPAGVTKEELLARARAQGFSL